MWDGPRLVNANWNPDNHQLNVNANDLTNQNSNLGVRPTRCFYAKFREYFIQPWVIRPISWSLLSISKYCLVSMIWQFRERRKRILSSSTLVLARRRTFSFS